MEDRIVVELPSRAWADVAVADLADVGCRAEVLAEPSAAGGWRLAIQGTPDQMAEIRAAVRTPAAP